jgi:hypothetical protein
MLTEHEVAICTDTISANAFYLIVQNALERQQELSVVRMADGERKLLDHCRANPDGIVKPFSGLTEEWLKRYGCLGIPRETLLKRIEEAAEQCTYFGPSLSGLTNPAYNIYRCFRPRARYVDNFFPNLWDDQQKTQLFRQARHVLFIHGSYHLADAMQNRAKAYHNVKVSYRPLTNWTEAEAVIEFGRACDARLVIFSAGPASKFIGPQIAQSGKVTLDIGQAADRWSFLHRFEQEKAAAAKAGHLAQFTRRPYEFHNGERKEKTTA